MRKSIWLLVLILVIGLTGCTKQAAEQEKKAAEQAKQAIQLQKETAPDGETRMVKTVDGIEYAFRWCPPGTFPMDRPSGKSGRYDDEKQHQVTLTKGFWMLETEVTQGMWRSVMGESVSEKAKQGTFAHDLYGEGSNYPMYYVSWDDCQEFCNKLSSKIGMKITLPTKAQWEYACQAGSTGAYAGDIDAMDWHDYSDYKTNPVGQKKPNAWGLYDMYGNVWEWCQDKCGELQIWCQNEDGDYSSYTVIDPTAPPYRVFLGSDWSPAQILRWAELSLYKYSFLRDYCVGFRVVVCPAQ